MHMDTIEGKRPSRPVGRGVTTPLLRLGGAIMLGTLLAPGAGCAATADRQSVGEYADDSVVTAKVKTALAGEDVASLLGVEVETYRGVVQLSGFVDDETQRLRAGEIAGEVEGVRRVENSLIVKPAS